MPMSPDGHTSSNMDILIRRISIYASLPGFILLIAHGIGSKKPFPALGVIPLFISAALNTILVRRDRIALGKSPTKSIVKGLIFCIDVLILAAHATLLIPTWIQITYPSYYWGGYNMGLFTLEVYATVFMIFDAYVYKLKKPLPSLPPTMLEETPRS